MVAAPLVRPLLRVPPPRASSSRLPVGPGSSAARRLLSTSRPQAATDGASSSSSSSSSEPASSFVWSPSLQWGFDTTKPVGKLFNKSGTKAVKDYHKHLMKSISATATSLSELAMGKDDAVVARLSRSTVLELVKSTSDPLLMYPTLKPLAEVSSPAQVTEQERIARQNATADLLNSKRELTMAPSWDRLFAESCEALNHNFFLSSLRNPEDPGSYPLKIEEHLVASFGSNSGFEQTVLGYAEGMTSSGWLWLVQERNGGKEDLAIVATYGAATLLVYGGQPIRGTTAQAFRHLGLSDQGHVFEEQAMRAPAESPTLSAEGEAQHRAFSTTAPTAAAESSSSSHGMGGLSHRKPMSSAFGMPTSSSSRPGPTSGRPTNLLTVANELVPLACLSLHEHAYLPTHGVWGKRPYVQAWLSALDWEKIERRMVDPVARQRSSRYF